MALRKGALTPTELQEMSKHVTYEFEMLVALAKVLQNSPFNGSLKKPLENATLESFLVHARQIISFFYDAPRANTSGPKDINDCCAADYAPQWAAQNPACPTDLQQQKERISQIAMHLTTRRADPTTPLDEVPEIAWKLAPLADSFLAAAPTDLYKHRPFDGWEFVDDPTKSLSASGRCRRRGTSSRPQARSRATFSY